MQWALDRLQSLATKASDDCARVAACDALLRFEFSMLNEANHGLACASSTKPVSQMERTCSTRKPAKKSKTCAKLISQ